MMEYQKKKKKTYQIIDNTTNQQSKFRTRNCFGINDESKGRYDNSNIRFKTSMIRSSLCDYSDPCILFKGPIIVRNTAAVASAVNTTNK